MPETAPLSHHVVAAARLLGLRWFVTRTGIALRRKYGIYEWQYPVHPRESAVLPASMLTTHPAPRFVSPDSQTDARDLFRKWDTDAPSPLAAADAVLEGRFPYFGHAEGFLGTTPDWFLNPFTGERAPMDAHWSRIGDFDHGDIKVIWEPSRFGWAFALTRAFSRSGDERYAEGFWQLYESWRAANPLHRGANWMCGQEAGFRLLAWCFARTGLAESQASTPERESQLERSVADSAERIEATLNYALSQRNNHGISEAAALWTAGLLLNAHPRAAKWRALGRRHLENQVRTLIDANGAFSQHSLNYQRVMLHACAWAIRQGDLAGDSLSADLRARVGSAADLLYQLQDASAGSVPRYGHNDGALILPLSNCMADDFRPVIQSVRYLAYGTRTYKPGPWDEELFWLCGANALTAPLRTPERTDLAATCSGYYSLRSPDSYAFLRCGKYLHRPGHADMLHVDLRWRGAAIAIDAGTYSYNARAPFDQAFSGAEFHNTVTVDERQPMDRVGRFLWLPWEQGKIHESVRSPARQFSALAGERDGYHRLSPPVFHRRALLRLGAESWLIVDRLSSMKCHDYRLHWLLEDFPHEWQSSSGQLTLQTPAGTYYLYTGASSDNSRTSLVRADSSGARGWQSPHYLELRPALSLALDSAANDVTFWSLFSAESIHCKNSGDGMNFTGKHWTARIHDVSATGQSVRIVVTSLEPEGDTLHVAL